MTELSDAMVERLEDEFCVSVDRDNGELGFCSNFGEDFTMNFNPANAFEDIVDQARNFDEDEHILLWTKEGRSDNPNSIADIADDADVYMDGLQYLLGAIKSRMNSGWTEKQFEDWFESKDAPMKNEGFSVDMENGIISFDSPSFYREIGTDEQMTAQDVLDCIQNEYDEHDVNDIVCEEVGVSGTVSGAPPITALAEDAEGIHKTLNDIADMLEEQRAVEARADER